MFRNYCCTSNGKSSDPDWALNKVCFTLELTTVTEAVPALAISPADTDAVSWLPVTYVVVNGEPFQRTVEPLLKPDPFTVRAKTGPPTVIDDGVRLEIVGADVPAM